MSGPVDVAPISKTASSDSFDALCDMIVVGHRMPSLAHLIGGTPFFHDDIELDAGAFAQEMMDRLGAPDDTSSSFLFALAELTAAPNIQDFLMAAAGFELIGNTPAGKLLEPDVSSVRCHFYAAVAGHRPSAHKVAAAAVTSAYSRDLPAAAVHELCRGAVAWLLVSTGMLALPGKWTRQSASDFLGKIDRVQGPGRRMLERVLKSRESALKDETADDLLVASAPADVKVRRRPTSQVPQANVWDDEMAEGDADQARSPGVVVLARVGNCQSAEGMRVAGEFQGILDQALPVGTLPNLTDVQTKLLSEFPHASAVVDTVLMPMWRSDRVSLRPIILVGSPGCGKSTFAVRLAELLGLPIEVFPCGSVSDGALAGTARRWATGEASLALSVIRAHHHAGPVILLDELDKAATSQANGAVVDALLAMTEPSTARRWRDPYVEAPVDLSHVGWIATANGLQTIPSALRDRCRVIRFPDPSGKHLASLAHRILVNIAVEDGMDERWVSPLEPAELSALAASWAGGSIRRLAKLVQVVAQARDHLSTRH